MSYNNYNYNNQGSDAQGEAASYYAAAGQQTQQHYQGTNQEYGDGEQQERGFLGAVGGGVAGGFGGNKIGNKTGHSKLGTVLGVVAGAVAGHKLQDGVGDWKDKRDEEREKKKREEEEEERRNREDEDRRRRDEEDRRRREEEDRRRASQPQQQQYHQSYQSHDSGTNYAGNFSSSSSNTRLDAYGEFLLHSECRLRNGSYQASYIGLNEIIGNSNGSFRWASGGANTNSSVTVQAGDTLRDIAQRHGASWQELAQINSLQNPDMIYPGQVLSLPGGGDAGGNFGASARNVRLEDGGRRLVAELRRGDGSWASSSINLDERIGNADGVLRFMK